MLSQLCPADFIALRFPIAAEIKYDGIRTIASIVKHTNGKVNIRLYSRNGKHLNNFEEINKLCETWEEGVYDGEIISPDGFQKLMTRTHAEKGKNTDVKIEYKVFDKLTHQEWQARYSARDYNSRCIAAKIGERVIIKNPVDLEIYYNYVLKSGHEGLILKKLDSPYESASKSYWYKLKPKDTMDLRIISVEEGTGKYTGMLGALQCQGELQGNPLYAFVGTGFTDAQRDELWKTKDTVLGKIVEIEFQEVTKRDKYGSMSLRFPVFKCLRLDK